MCIKCSALIIATPFPKLLHLKYISPISRIAFYVYVKWHNLLSGIFYVLENFTE